MDGDKAPRRWGWPRRAWCWGWRVSGGVVVPAQEPGSLWGRHAGSSHRGRKPGSGGRKNGGMGSKAKDKKLSGTDSEQEVSEALRGLGSCSPGGLVGMTGSRFSPQRWALAFAVSPPRASLRTQTRTGTRRHPCRLPRPATPLSTFRGEPLFRDPVVSLQSLVVTWSCYLGQAWRKGAKG